MWVMGATVACVGCATAGAGVAALTDISPETAHVPAVLLEVAAVGIGMAITLAPVAREEASRSPQRCSYWLDSVAAATPPQDIR